MSQSHAEAVAMVVSVIRDNARIDRFLRVADDGSHYTTPDKTYLTGDGPETPPYVSIPFGGDDVSDDDADEWADSLIRELDEQVAE